MDFFAGCLGGCAGVLVGHPFDTVKVRLQTQDFRNPTYKGTWDCFSTTLKAEGPKGLFKGMSSPLSGVAVVNAVIFGAHSHILRMTQDPTALRSQVIAGSSAGFIQAFISSPMELVKTRLQIQGENTEVVKPRRISTGLNSWSAKKAVKAAGPLDIIKKIYKAEGIKGIYRGQTITIMREIPAFGVYFFAYESMSRAGTARGADPSTLLVLTAGGCAGIASWSLTYPIDLIKSRIQTDGMNGPNQYRGIMDCVRQSYRQEGVGAFTRGFSSTILRAFPTNAATFAVYTWTMKALSNDVVGLEHDDLQEVLRRSEGLAGAVGDVLTRKPKCEPWITINIPSGSVHIPSIAALLESESRRPRRTSLRNMHYFANDEMDIEEEDEDEEDEETFFFEAGRVLKKYCLISCDNLNAMRNFVFTHQARRTLEHYTIHLITLTM